MSQFKHQEFAANWLMRDALCRELSDLDERQLLDVGVVRAEDGSLRLAEDPTQRVVPTWRGPGLFARVATSLRRWFGNRLSRRAGGTRIALLRD